VDVEGEGLRTDAESKGSEDPDEDRALVRA
jgi:hypothetical protein